MPFTLRLGLKFKKSNNIKPLAQPISNIDALSDNS